MTRLRFIYRDGKFWFRAHWVDQAPSGYPRVRRNDIGPFATLDAAWEARTEA